MKKILKSMALIVTAVFLSFSAQGFEGLNLDVNNLKELEDARADEWNMVGNTLVISGNVYIPFGDLTVYADSAVIDLDSRDAEISGNIRAFRVRKGPMTLSMQELVEMRRNPMVTVKVESYETDPLGEQLVKAMVFQRGDFIKARRMAINLNTEFAEFDDVDLFFSNFGAKATHGTRKAGGEITLTDAEISSCSYMHEGNAHYSIYAGKVDVRPHQTATIGVSNTDNDIGEHSFIAYNVQVKAYGVPVLWLPVFYKPKDESPGLFKMQIGDNSDWGFYVLASKKFQISDSPHASVKVLADYYNMRGFGYGAESTILTADSKTEIFGYGIYDMRPYYSSDVEDTGRLDIPHMRYDFRISNVTHITPRLDFRGHFEMLSDMYFLEDFYRYSFNNNPEPATFAALEYQFDQLSTALYIRPQVNDFFTTVERLPEWRLDVPRQQVFGSEYLYYQSETSADYLQMKWREFDRDLPDGYSDTDNYESFRFDTVHFLYLPLRFWGINFIPRVGGRFTAYSNSSKQRVDESDLNSMFVMNRSEGNDLLTYNQYDNNGEAIGRFIGEFGAELNTKFSRSWQNVRNAYWRLDGLRHVIEPYANYTFIPEPTESRDYIYYFDDIDRIEEQNFFRLGLRNRLETRTGSFGNEQIREFFTIENFWDIYLNSEDDMNAIGDFCTKIEFNPGNGFSVDTLFVIDAGGNNAHDTEANRRGRNAGRPGIGNDWLNMWEINLKYELFQDCQVSLGYVYQDAYASRSAYSMGSTLSQIQGGSYFDNYYNERTQCLRFGIMVPLSTDRSFRGAYDIYYDFEAGCLREQRLSFVKKLHCWEVAAEFAVEQDYDSDGEKEYEYSFMVTAYLTGLFGPAQQAQSLVQQGFSEMGSDGGLTL